MPEHASLLEVRPREFGTDTFWWPNAWQPAISAANNHSFFFWALNVEAPELNAPSALEQDGLDDNPYRHARDRFVELRWEMLHPARCSAHFVGCPAFVPHRSAPPMRACHMRPCASR